MSALNEVPSAATLRIKLETWRAGLLLGLLLALTSSASALAQSNSTFPTHCTPEEFAFLNAKFDHLTGGTPIENPKLLSLCADKPDEPFGRFTYRYGTLGKVELEHVGTATDKFLIHNRATTNRTGEFIFGFSKGAFTYYVVEHSGMARGVSVLVLKSGKKVSELYSGLDWAAYETNLAHIEFDKASSPVFVTRRLNVPLSRFYRPPTSVDPRPPARP
jgi:hypothetical protein